MEIIARGSKAKSLLSTDALTTFKNSCETFGVTSAWFALDVVSSSIVGVGVDNVGAAEKVEFRGETEPTKRRWWTS